MLIRYITMLLNMRWGALMAPPPIKSNNIARVDIKGYSKGPNLSIDQVKSAMAIYAPRSLNVEIKPHGHPFLNLFNEEDINSNNPIFRFAFSANVLDAAFEYFRGKMILDSIQVLYSYPTSGDLRESQHWHLDYGDRKSFHCVTYLNDVLESDDGPFVYVDKIATKRIGRSFIVRRITDDQFSREHNDKIESFYGVAGSSVFVDPSACYHYGSRCKTPRFAIFVTFSSWFPFVQPVPLVTSNIDKIIAEAQKVRPDLSEAFLKSLLQKTKKN